MASMYVDFGEENKDHLHNQHHHHQTQSSPRQLSPKEMKKTWSANASPTACGQGNTAPKCVCAPATHAGSFKCRLHRVNSQSHTPAPAPQPAVSSASTRTVEAV